MIIVSAPGKIHLLGEHTVVYGRPALLAAIDKRLYVRIQNNKKEKIIINASENSNLVKKSIEVFKKAFVSSRLPPLEITITSQIPVGSGLGSSAALSAAVIGALMKFVKNIWNPNKINELSFTVEKIAHGNPSGADNTTVVFGGLVWFRLEFDFLKSIWNLPTKNYKIPKFFLIDSGKPLESTKIMVSQIGRLYSRNKKMMEEIFNDQERQTKRLLVALKNGDNNELISCIRKGEQNLEKIGVVGSFAQKIIREIESIGGAVKVCGGGGQKQGSGILLCYHPSFSKLKNIAVNFKTPIFPVQLGCEGIRIEQ